MFSRGLLEVSGMLLLAKKIKRPKIKFLEKLPYQKQQSTQEKNNNYCIYRNQMFATIYPNNSIISKAPCLWYS